MTAHHRHQNDDGTDPACRLDHTTGTRLTPDGQTCDHHHCVTCTRAHVSAGALVCGDCMASVRRDLEDIRFYARHLRWHASRGEGLSVPSARIPGGDAMVILARAGAGHDDLRTSHGHAADAIAEDHPDDDVVPLLLTLVGWEHQWRTHFGHPDRLTRDPATRHRPKPGRRSPVTAITHYLTDQLTPMSRATTGPDWVGFAEDMQALRRQLEGVLHDEQEPQTGVPCFDCGRRLVRRWGTPRPCTHPNTPGRRHIAAVKREAREAQARIDVLVTYPELGEPTYEDQRAARRVPTSAEETAARQPCDACVASETGQGGIADPSVGQSWECLGCRKEFTAKEYIQAVRSYLLTSGPDRDGWTHVAMAAEAASTMTGVAIAATTVRRWMDRGLVVSVCRWHRGEVGGQRLVFWPSVAEQAARAVERAQEAARERAIVDLQRSRLAAAVAAGASPEDAGKSLGIHPARVARFVGEWDAAARTGKEAS